MSSATTYARIRHMFGVRGTLFGSKNFARRTVEMMRVDGRYL